MAFVPSALSVIDKNVAEKNVESHSITHFAEKLKTLPHPSYARTVRYEEVFLSVEKQEKKGSRFVLALRTRTPR